jgi:hypothetical protein
MSGLVALGKRLKALEARYSPRQRIRITGGLPDGMALIQSAAAQVREPLCPALAVDHADPGPEPMPDAATESIKAKAHEP